MDELTREFLIESQEGLDRMERCLTDLETRPDDKELLADIFRSVHTIKGTTGFLGFKRLEHVAHAGENLLGLLRDGVLPAGPPVISGLLHLLDALRSILKTVEADGNEGSDNDQILIEELVLLQDPETSQFAALKSSPVETALPKPRADSPAEAPAATPAADDAARRSARVAPGASAAESTLRVDIALLNRMMNLVGELVLTRNQVLQATAADPRMTVLSRRLDMVTADLRESVMKARLQPISNIFSKMPRIVRDVSQALGRRVRLEVEGQDTELDKSLLEAIKDPLTHAVRNALDHGIEAPEVRRAAGKDPEGVLRLRAVQEGSHVLIDVSDDGAGIAVDRVRQKAMDRGLLTPERAAHLSDRELLQYIFMPGFSTAAAVTNISGRGVGMDVVRTNVERIGGKVELDSRTGRGTTLRLRIPLTLAIIPALIVRSRGQSFAVPQAALSELVHVCSDASATGIEWIEDAPLYRLRGQLLPLVFVDHLLQQDTVSAARADQNQFIAVLEADGRRYGLVVDGLADPEEIVVKPLSAVLKSIGIYSGATVLGNGALALILDPGAIAIRCRVGLRSEGDQVSQVEQTAAADSAEGPDYLLVDIAGRQAAIPLGDVLRIEQIAATRIEYLGARPVLHIDGSVLAVDDPGGLLEQARASGGSIAVVVCRRDRQQIGVAVSHVLEVAAGADLHEAGSDDRADGIVLMNNQITGVLSPMGAAAPLTCPSSDTFSQFAARAL